MDKKTGQLLEVWKRVSDNLFREDAIDLDESPIEKKKRIAYLEANPEKWKKHYFSKFYTADPAKFHIDASKKIINTAEFYLVLSWSRELAKSTRTMMDVIYLVLTKKKKNVLLVSYSADNAEMLLRPYKNVFEQNERIKHDYGDQFNYGNWKERKFVLANGASFRSLGKGESPRGAKNDEARPDVILIDDIDTDEECRNPDRIKESVNWIEQALIPTRSISEPLLIIACGNIIATYCCITEMAKRADFHDIVNIRDKFGKSSWPQKNTEAHIDRVLSQISWASAQKEYFNNPIVEGSVFKEISWDKVPRMEDCDEILIYADPATSNKDKAANKKNQASTKFVGVIGRKGLKYYIYTCWLDVMNNSQFIDCLFEAHQYVSKKGLIHKIYIENNSLQDPFYEQVLSPLIRQKANDTGIMIPITPDTRRKPEKYFRIEGTLEPINRLGNLIFNKAEENNPNMRRLESQFLGVSPNAKVMDGPDGVEGGVWILQNRSFNYNNDYRVGARASRKY
ncbi:hypothetical protein EIB75_10680 [Epilithonimonas vandammei]|uniref:Terminase large subunit gp17-like C-terminal domain-containing protein n=1 Tax=Epilithonimonas vandammei TaxID=2487072 RepID=A0A3G8ZGH4_9FLAO|nr:hypothetical protein [Epilithonimonas vandammei]AZI53894.1 hypothetical protein EIB75_00870 [Epilithonimonas vandammei]AZI55687.1 hypothetical protein EIB75_10680 [Epilithonimonas vandammei]